MAKLSPIAIPDSCLELLENAKALKIPGRWSTRPNCPNRIFVTGDDDCAYRQCVTIGSYLLIDGLIHQVQAVGCNGTIDLCNGPTEIVSPDICKLTASCVAMIRECTSTDPLRPADPVEPPEPVEPIDCPIGEPFQVYLKGDESKIPECFWMQNWKLINGTSAIAPVGADPNTESININLYSMKLTELGQLAYESPIVVTQIPYHADGLTICTDGTAQDLVALATPAIDAFIAEILALGFVVPAGYSLKPVTMAVQQYTDKQVVNCDITGAPLTVTNENQIPITGLGNDSFLTVGAKLPYGNPLFDDGTCKGCAPAGVELVAGDIILDSTLGTGPTGAPIGGPDGAVKVDFCIACVADAGK